MTFLQLRKAWALTITLVILLRLSKEETVVRAFQNPPVAVTHHGLSQPPTTNHVNVRLLPPPTSTPPRLRMQNWEGDDIRWSTWMKRKLMRRQSELLQHHLIRSVITSTHWSLYIYQIFTTILKLRRRFPQYWRVPSRAMEMIIDAIWGSTVIDASPLVQSLGFTVARARFEPFRYVTAGWIHSGFVHLLLTTYAMTRGQPGWLESGLGAPLYLTTYLCGIVGGNIIHAAGASNPWDGALCLGPTAGICALYGLQYACLIKMGGRGYRQILRGLGGMLAMGYFMDVVSNAANSGGLLCGIGMGVFFGPSYTKDYAMRRKNSVEFDPVLRDYRQVMGFGVMPTRRGLIPLTLLWTAILVALVTNPQYRIMPLQVVKALLRPLRL